MNSEIGPAIAYRADETIRGWEEFSETFGPDYGAGPSMDYDAYPGRYIMWHADLFAGEPGHGWRPSIHMPRWASRITLEVTEVRVERVQSITWEDALAEGVEYTDDPVVGSLWYPAAPGQATSGSATEAFHVLWDSINGKREGCAWADDPWCWVVTFRRVET